MFSRNLVVALACRNRSSSVVVLRSTTSCCTRSWSSTTSIAATNHIVNASRNTSTTSTATTNSSPVVKTSFHLPDPTTTTSTDPSKRTRLELTKIVATIGPTSEQYKPLKKVVEAGMRIMRLNFSHATVEEVELRCTNLTKAQLEQTRHNQEVRAILLDTKGPEIRTGKLANDESGHETVHLQAKQKITLHTDTKIRDAGSSEKDLFIDYPSLHKCLSPGMKVLLDDGNITLTVESVDASSKTVLCVIDNSGDLRSRAGVNLPLADTSDLPAMSPKDKQDIQYGMTKDIDYVAASFIQNAAGVHEIRQHIRDCAKTLDWPKDKPLPLIISKIETAGALVQFDEILAASDGIMVARGDLGVEIPLQQVVNAQKEMIAACNAVGKPVIVATQMLESMGKNPRPTRAEVSDVTNAVYDGADAVMLSGESAKGKYPVQSVQFMNEIIRAAEGYASSGALGHVEQHSFLASPKNRTSAMARAAVTAAHERPNCAAILVLDRGHSSTLPQLVASFRPHVPVFAFCPMPKMARQLQLYRGIHPIVMNGTGDPKQAMEMVKEMGYLLHGDEVVVVTMEENGDAEERTGTMKIATVP